MCYRLPTEVLILNIFALSGKKEITIETLRQIAGRVMCKHSDVLAEVSYPRVLEAETTYPKVFSVKGDTIRLNNSEEETQTALKYEADFSRKWLPPGIAEALEGV